jgi:hypothetical protein
MEQEQTTELAQRNTVTMLVSQYQRAVKEMTAGYTLIHRAQERSPGALECGMYRNAQIPELKECIKTATNEMKSQVWRKIVEMLNVRQMMSTEQAKKLDAQLYGRNSRNHCEGEVEPLPEVTEANIWQTIKGMCDSMPEFQNAAICEAFEIIRYLSTEYKSTDGRFAVGQKGVLGWIVGQSWRGGRMQIRYGGADQKMRVIENAFRLLDGKGPSQSHQPELAEKLQAGNEGETEYYRFKAYKNGNLHIYFKRMDLVSTLNQIGAKGRRELDKAV